MTTIMCILLDDLVGGTPMRILKIAQGLPTDKYKVLVVMPNGTGDFGALLESAGITVYRLDLKRLRYKLNPKYILEWIVNLPCAYRQISEIIKKHDVDILHAFGLTQIIGPVVGKIMKIKVVWQINDLLTPFSGFFLPILKSVSDVIAISSDAVQKQYFPSVDDKTRQKLVKLYSAIDADLYSSVVSRTTTRKEFGVDDDTVLVGTVGNLNKFKGHIHLINAIPYIQKATSKKVKYIIVGQILQSWNDYYNDIVDTIERLGLKDDVIITGKRLDIPDLLGAIDVYAHPSLSESFGLAIIEAMAAGKPVVATNVGGIPEIIPNVDYGTLVPSCDPPALARALTEYIEDADKARNIGKIGQERVREIFNIDVFIKNHENLYDGLYPRKS
jgi:glycosyltransferase involved in cell wall biosynthesis